MAFNYFVDQYAPMNGIDPGSDDSIRRWLNNCVRYYGDEIGKHLGDLTKKNILDLGCGIGGMIHYLKSRHAGDVTGVDISPDQLAVCKKYVSTNVVCADALEYLKTVSVKYDYIIALDLIEHLPKNQIQEFCRSIFDSLNDGGSVIIKTPNMGSLYGLRSRYLDFTHEVGFTEESLRQVFVEAGFRQIKLHNSHISKKRMVFVRLLHRLIEKIYALPQSSVMTQNMVLAATK